MTHFNQVLNHLSDCVEQYSSVLLRVTAHEIISRSRRF